MKCSSANILNKQLCTAKKGLGIGFRGQNLPTTKKISTYEILHRALDLDAFFRMTYEWKMDISYKRTVNSSFHTVVLESLL